MDSSILDLFGKFGFPTAIIIVGILALWRISHWFAPRVEIWVNRLVQSHEDLTKSCISIGESNSATLGKLETVQAAQTAAVHRIETTMEELRKTQKEMHSQNQKTQALRP